MAGAVDDSLAVNVGLGVRGAVTHSRDAAALDDNADHFRVLDDPHAAHARAPGERLGEVGGIRLAITRNPDGAGEIVGAQERIDLSGFCG